MNNSKRIMSFKEALEEYKKNVVPTTYTVHTDRGDSRKVKGWNIAYVNGDEDHGRVENRYVIATEKGKFLFESEHITHWQGENDTYDLEYLTEFGPDTIGENLRLSLEKEFKEKLPDVEISDIIPELSDDEVDHDEQ